MSVVGGGAIAGPGIGGLLVAAFGWQPVFFVNVPIILITIIISWYVLDPNQETFGDEPGGRPTFDWPGAALSGIALLAFLLVVGNGERQGWTSPLIASGGAITVVLLAAFAWLELHARSPMLDLSLFRKKLVAMGISASWLSFLGASSARFMMPFYLQRVQEFEPRDAGLLLIPPAVCMIVIGPVSGRLSDRFGWQGLTVGGRVLSAMAWFALAATLSESSPVILIVGMLMAQSIGMALFASPNNSSIFSAVERHQYGVTSALTQLVRNSANATSIAIATTIVVATIGARGMEASLDAV
jgi:MFS family permease